MIFVTTMAYSPDGSTVLSGSADASACCTVVSRKRTGAGGTNGGAWNDVAEKAYALLVAAVLAWLFFTVGRLAARLQTAAIGPDANGGAGGDVERIDMLAGLKYGDIKRLAADVRRRREAGGDSPGGDASAPGADESHKPTPDDTERLFADEDPTPYECVDGENIRCEDVLTEPEAWEMRVKKKGAGGDDGQTRKPKSRRRMLAPRRLRRCRAKRWRLGTVECQVSGRRVGGIVQGTSCDASVTVAVLHRESLVFVCRHCLETAPLFSPSPSSACDTRSWTDLSRSSIRSPISSMRLMMLSLICWKRDCICVSRFWTCVGFRGRERRAISGVRSTKWGDDFEKTGGEPSAARRRGKRGVTRARRGRAGRSQRR